MEKDLGYQELVLLANRLKKRCAELAKDADDAQSDGVGSYVIAQNNSLEQARFSYETAHNEMIVAAKEILKTCDEKAAVAILNAYGKYGIKEI